MEGVEHCTSIRRAIKQIVVILGAYHFCQLCTKFYPTSCFKECHPHCVSENIRKQLYMDMTVITQLYCQLFITCQLRVLANTIFGHHQIGYS